VVVLAMPSTPMQASGVGSPAEVINNCPIFDYTRDGLLELFTGFANVEIRLGKSGFLLRATA
jgi:hypothetical protein